MLFGNMVERQLETRIGVDDRNVLLIAEYLLNDASPSSASKTLIFFYLFFYFS